MNHDASHYLWRSNWIKVRYMPDQKRFLFVLSFRK
jgi:hypothetical protein